MSFFIGTFENRIDRKGRVSVPAPFRAAVHGSAFPGIICFCSFRFPALEGAGMDYMQKLNSERGKIDFFQGSPQDEERIFASSRPLNFDGDGRITLPADFIAHGGFSDKATFVGGGDIFQIWHPEKLDAHMAAMRSGKAASEGGQS